MCNGTGYVILKQVIEGTAYDYAYACDCKNGDNKLYDGRTIKDKDHRSPYYIPRYSAVIPTN